MVFDYSITVKCVVLLIVIWIVLFGIVICDCGFLFILYCDTLTEGFFRVFPSVVRQMPGYNSLRRGTASTLSSLMQ